MLQVCTYMFFSTWRRGVSWWCRATPSSTCQSSMSSGQWWPMYHSKGGFFLVTLYNQPLFIIFFIRLYFHGFVLLYFFLSFFLTIYLPFFLLFFLPSICLSFFVYFFINANVRHDKIICDLLELLNFVFVSPIFLVASFFPWIRSICSHYPPTHPPLNSTQGSPFGHYIKIMKLY